MTAFPGFDEFYTAVHGRDPFPWQSRLAATVTAAGWPADIGVPTGLGKTSAIDIAVWALARDTTRPEQDRSAPRRIWYVVDRRLLVDAASDHASSLAQRLAAATDGPLAAVAAALRGLCATTTDPPLHVSRLRGGTGAQDAVRVRDPAQPAVLCATVAMYASRLLFRGYGGSRSLWPVEAAHAGTDALVLLDEAHLAPALQELVAALPDCDAPATGVLRFPPVGRVSPGPGALLPGRAYPRLVNLTATGAAAAFDLDADDGAHPVVRQRLTAAKPTRLVATTADALPDALAEQAHAAVTSRGPDTAAVVFTNTPGTARQVAQQLHGLFGDQADVVTLTGLLRDPDAAEVRRRLLDPASGAPSSGRARRSRPLIVVATQTLEVGADLDFDVCVSQTAGVRALVQRWGRLNRLGRTSDAVGVLVHPVDDPAVGLYGGQPAAVWDRLSSTGRTTVDLGPEAIAAVLGPAHDAPGRTAALLPAHLWEFAKTTVPPVGAAPPEVFFDTIDDPDLRISVLWRAVLPEPGQPLDPPPRAAETVDVPIGQVRDLLADITDARLVDDDGATVQAAASPGLRPGARVVLPAEAGGYGPAGWDPDRRDPVSDLSPALSYVLHLTTPAVANLLGGPVDETLTALLAALAFDPDTGPDPAADAQSASDLAAALAALQPTGPLAGARRIRIDRVGVDLDPVLRWEPPAATPPVAVDALDELSNAPRVGLDDHLAAVAELAGRIAAAIGLPEDLVHAVSAAGLLHDLGKADPRFQRWLGADAGTPLAKSAMPPAAWRRAAAAAGWPAGGRHELLSAQLIDTWLQQGGHLPDADLVTHLVLAHHGNARPWCPHTTGGAAVDTTAIVAGHTVTCTTDTSRPDWTQPDRFQTLNERYGYWALALLEAVVRQADHRVSAATEVI